MRKGRFSEERVLGILRAHEAGMPTAEVCRTHGISDATFYKGKARYGGLEVAEARRLRALEDENGQLERLLAEAMPDNAALKDLLRNNGPRPQRRAGGLVMVDPKTVRRTAGARLARELDTPRSAGAARPG